MLICFGLRSSQVETTVRGELYIGGSPNARRRIIFHVLLLSLPIATVLIFSEEQCAHCDGSVHAHNGGEGGKERQVSFVHYLPFVIEQVDTLSENVEELIECW